MNSILIQHGLKINFLLIVSDGVNSYQQILDNPFTYTNSYQYQPAQVVDETQSLLPAPSTNDTSIENVSPPEPLTNHTLNPAQLPHATSILKSCIENENQLTNVSLQAIPTGDTSTQNNICSQERSIQLDSNQVSTSSLKSNVSEGVLNQNIDHQTKIIIDSPSNQAKSTTLGSSISEGAFNQNIQQQMKEITGSHSNQAGTLSTNSNISETDINHNSNPKDCEYQK